MPRLSQKDQEQYLKKKDPVLGKVIDAVQLKPLRRGRGRKKATDYFEVLTYSIISQQISTKAAATITERFRGLFPEEKPTPERVAQLTPAKLRTVGVSGQKASYIKDLSAHVLDGRLDLEVLPKLPDEEVIEMLTDVKGIGRWTAEMFLLFSLKRKDVFSFLDLGLKNACIKLYNLRKPVSQKRLEAVSKKWSPYRSLASRYLWASLDNQ